MTAARMTNLKRALTDPNISPGKKAVLATVLESLNAITANSAKLPLIGGLVTNLVDATPPECLHAVDQMLASINAFDPFFFNTTQNALLSCINSRSPIAQLFGQRINMQNNFQFNLILAGIIELVLIMMNASSMTITNPWIRAICFLFTALVLLGVSTVAAYILQENENKILLERNAIKQVKDAVSAPISTTAGLLSSWAFRGVDPADNVAQRMQRGLVMAPPANAPADEWIRFTSGLVCKWMPISLKSAYNGLTSFAKQSSSLPASATTPRPLASFR